jgi:polysaccharide export outer membrane protein
MTVSTIPHRPRSWLYQSVSGLCGLLLTTLAVSAAGAGSPGSTAAQAEYVLQPLDLLKVVVFQETDLEREVRLTQESSVSLPLVGTISLKGRTTREAQQLISEAYEHDYLVNPQISLTVLEYSKQTVNVLGAVTTAGSILIPPEQPLNLLDAVARAGGFTRLADRRHLKLTRIGGDDKKVTYEINADDVIQGSTDKTWILKNGDVIFVPERIL